MSKTVTASHAFSEVARNAEKIKNSEPATIATMSPADVVRQGDIYVLALDRPIPGGKPTGMRQLAPGTSQGSRHIAEGDCDILTVAEADAIAALRRLVPATKRHLDAGHPIFIGPMILARGPVNLTHPEHGWREIPGDAAYLVVYQCAYADVVRRQLD